jgi:ribosomal protein S6
VLFGQYLLLNGRGSYLKAKLLLNQTKMAESENKYELMVIVDPGIGLAGVEKRLESIRKQISKSGKIFFEDIWGERDLAYTMKGHKKGHYAIFDFTFEGDKLKEFETGLTLDPEVIRHLIVKLPLKYEPKSLEDIQNSHQEEKAAEKKD